MPVINGAEATRRIRSFLKNQEPKVKQPFICCLTSYNVQNFKVEAKRAEMDAFLVKPIFKTGVKKLLDKIGVDIDDN